MLDRRELAIRIESNMSGILSQWVENQFSEEVINRWNIKWATGINRDQLVKTYLKPLIRLMLAYLKTENEVYLYGYLNERLRYAPHRQSPGIRADFFKHTLTKDIQSILEYADLKDGDDTSIVALLDQIHEPLTNVSEVDSICMFALGDCLMTEVREFLPQICRKNDINLDMRCIYFSSSMERGIDLDEILFHIRENKVDIIAMSFLSYDALPVYSMLLRECDSLSKKDIDERLDMIMHVIVDMMHNLREHTEATFLLHNTSGLPLGRYRKRIPFFPVFSSGKRYVIESINKRLRDLAAATPNTLLIDEYGVANSEGFRKCAKAVYPKSVIKDGMLHTGFLGYYLSLHYQAIMQAYGRLRKCKAIMVDFDNTLWKGVMADGEVQHYADRQKLLKRLKDMGILLISVSKNTMENIRWEEMVLQEEDFALHRINWDLKVNSVSSAVGELNIGMDTIVFIDDNPVELDMVQQELKEIIAMDATDEQTWNDLVMMTEFPNTKETEESRNRTTMYRQSFERNKSISAKKYDYPKLMASLELKVGFRQAQASDLERIYELVSRTNQFNTTTVRYSKDEITAMMNSDTHKVCLATLGDKFGALGVVLVVIIELQEDAAILSSFIMSCRAMGFALENQILHLIANRDLLNRDKLVGIYRATDRNTPCALLYQNNHFTQLNDTNWCYEIDKSEPIPAIEWISMEN